MDDVKEKEVINSKLDPDAPEFKPVWPLSPPSHLRSAALKPLLFPEPGKEDSTYLIRRSRDLPLPCVLCERCFDVDVVSESVCEDSVWERVRDELLRHLLVDHFIVIHQVDRIVSLSRYCHYWKNRFSEVSDISQFCPVIRTNTDVKDCSLSCDYHMMSDALPEDRQLRQSLQLARLEAILDQQQSERIDTKFKRSCLFCGLVVMGNRAPLFLHMLKDHNFNIGQPDNIVFSSEFLDLLQAKLDKFLCLYCEKVFKDKNTLKEHMRKKQHKKINPDNTEYDRFYVINYLEPGRRWQEIMADEEEEEDETTDTSPSSSQIEQYDDWRVDSGQLLYCLFCSLSYTTSHLQTLTHHMKEAHGFDLGMTMRCYDYYQQVKAINYLRREVARQHCPACHTHCSSEDHLMLHMDVKGHCSLPSDSTIWDQSLYLFPTFENDALLCCLDDNDDDNPHSIPTETTPTDNKSQLSN